MRIFFVQIWRTMLLHGLHLKMSIVVQLHFHTDQWGTKMEVCFMWRSWWWTRVKTLERLESSGLKGEMMGKTTSASTKTVWGTHIFDVPENETSKYLKWTSDGRHFQPCLSYLISGTSADASHPSSLQTAVQPSTKVDVVVYSDCSDVWRSWSVFWLVDVLWAPCDRRT